MSSESLSASLDEVLAMLAQKYRVPGATVAVLDGDKVSEACTGVVNVETGVPVTGETLFQVGSVTKVLTATVVMQLVEEGLLDLDVPIVGYLSAFRTQVRQWSDLVTARHLLAHTGGFEGDVFTDTGNNDDALARYVSALAGVSHFRPPGALFSYSNAGYSVLGRLIEVLLGDVPFEQALRARLAQPLELRGFATGAGEAILFRTAVGHIRTSPDGEERPSPVWSLPRSGSAFGATLCMSARDLLGFARTHLCPQNDSARSLLSPESVAAMQVSQADLSFLGMPIAGRGLGWAIYASEGEPTIGHDGATIGQYAYLRLVPSRGLAIALLTNGGDAAALANELLPHLLRTRAGVGIRQSPMPCGHPAPSPSQYEGRYESGLVSIHVDADRDGRLWAEATPLGVAAIGGEQERYELKYVDGHRFVRVDGRSNSRLVHAFVDRDTADGWRYLHTGRAHRRRDDGD